jgi:replicative DNA helicase
VRSARIRRARAAARLEAECPVGAVTDNAAIHAVYTELKPDDFYHPVHRQLYSAMLALTQENQPVDLHTLSDWLTIQKQLDAIGGTVFLAEIADYEATSANVLPHARIVRDKSIKRRLIATATEIVELGFDEGDRADRLLDQAESRIFEISSQNARATFARCTSEMQRTFDYVDAIMGRGGELTGFPPATSSSTT